MFCVVRFKLSDPYPVFQLRHSWNYFHSSCHTILLFDGGELHCWLSNKTNTVSNPLMRKTRSRVIAIYRSVVIHKYKFYDRSIASTSNLPTFPHGIPYLLRLTSFGAALMHFRILQSCSLLLFSNACGKRGHILCIISSHQFKSWWWQCRYFWENCRYFCLW